MSYWVEMDELLGGDGYWVEMDELLGGEMGELLGENNII